MSNKFILEPLEPRLLLSGDPYSAALASDGIDAATYERYEPAPPSRQPEPDTQVNSPVARPSERDGRQILVVDSQVQGYEDLLEELSLDRDSVFEIVVLDAVRDGISQITDVLGSYNDIEGLHILSHGSAGGLALGSTSLPETSVASGRVVWRRAVSWARNQAAMR